MRFGIGYNFEQRCLAYTKYEWPTFRIQAQLDTATWVLTILIQETYMYK